MPRSAPIQNSFNGGELSPLIKARIDLNAKYNSGCELLENFIPQIYGPARKRNGFRFIGEVKNSADNTELIPFEFSDVQAYILEFGDQYIRFYRNGGRVLESNLTITNITQANPAVVTSAGHGYSNGDYVYIADGGGMTELDGRYFTVAGVTANTFQLSGVDSTGYTAYSTGGTVARVYEITSPYLAADVSNIRFAQNADVIHLAHDNYAPRKLSRTGHTSWTLTEVNFDWPPFNDENVGSTTIQVSAATGSVTLTASAALFDADMVGGHYKLSEIPESVYDVWKTATVYGAGAYTQYDGNVYYTSGGGTSGTRAPVHESGSISDGGVTWTYVNDGSGYAEITAYTDTTHVTATVIVQLPQSSVTGATTRWSEAAWSTYRGFPRVVTFYEDRLWFAGSTNNPQTLWASVSSDYENFKQGTVDDAGLNYTINSTKVDKIEWIAGSKVLSIGTMSNEFVASASSPDAAITPTDVRIVPSTSKGCAFEFPIHIDEVTLFLQRSEKKLREFVYSFENDRYVSPNLTVLSEHITEDGIYDLTYQQEPDQIVWSITKTTYRLAALTYERPENVVAWHRHVTTNGDFKSIAVIPYWDGSQDTLFAIIERVVNGNTVKYVEYMEKYYTDEYAFFVDSGLTYDGTAVSTVSGLDHLEGETVSILADGAVHPQKVVSGGSITLDYMASVINVGLPMTAKLKTMPLEAGSRDGVAQGKYNRINEITIKVLETGSGLMYGPDANNLEEYYFRSTEDLTDTAVPLFTGVTERLAMPSQYELESQVYLEHNSPLPCTILAIMPQYFTNDR